MATFTSPFSDVVHTNDIPSQQDMEHVKELLLEPRKRLTALDGKISELKRTLSNLETERKALDDEIQAHEHFMAPFRRFPDDILQEIFMACLPEYHNAVMSPEEAPLILTRICRRWRTLSRSTPRLWATLHLVCPDPVLKYNMSFLDAQDQMKYYDNQTEQHCGSVKDWLSLSGSCPLSISFHAPYAQSEPVVWEPYFDILESYSHRWYRLEISIHYRDLAQRIKAIPAMRMPLLSHLHIVFLYQGTEVEGWETTDLFKVPKLQTLDVTQFPQPATILGINIWRNISVLNLIRNGPSDYFWGHKTTLNEAHHIFSQCHQLTHCAIEIFDNPMSAAWSPGVTSISLPFLQSITIFDVCNNLSLLFECFTDMSSIHTTSYHTEFLPSDDRRSPFITLLSRVKSQITRMTTCVSQYTLSDLRDVYSLLPHLTHLTITSERPHVAETPVPFDQDFIDFLAPADGQPPYCPRLQSMDCTFKSLFTVSDSQLISLLKRRMEASNVSCSGVVPLKEFRAVFVRHVQIDVKSHLAKYVENGPLTLSLTYTTRNEIKCRSQYQPHARLLTRDPQSGLVSIIPFQDL
ncbi:hypothetical protein BDN70DRAFT_838345 [Pholiota conissans]|uniref:F-box domain-containing protein n=1 Tax=Pholiota conissans TaxID=109636 RepID=A0A9P5YXV5_9AGAR|nr:hypothetical protein BDN70DRAFT_838345 [Pholiota conissans]